MIETFGKFLFPDMTPLLNANAPLMRGVFRFNSASLIVIRRSSFTLTPPPRDCYEQSQARGLLFIRCDVSNPRPRLSFFITNANMARYLA